MLYKAWRAAVEGRIPYRASVWLRSSTYIEIATEVAFRLVYLTQPIDSAEDASLECVTLLGHGAVPAYLVAVKSFARFSHKRIRVTVISDGTLSRGDLRLLRRHVRGIRIKNPEDFQQARFSQGAELQEVRHRSVHTRKFLDLPFDDLAAQVLLLDSDIIFTREPGADFFDLSVAPYRFGRDHDHSVCDDMFHHVELFVRTKELPSLVSNLNSGLVLFQSSALNTELAEEFFLTLKRQNAYHYVMEQDCWNVLASASGGLPLSDRYWIGCNHEHWESRHLAEAAVAKHYVGGIRYATLGYLKDFLGILPTLWRVEPSPSA
jgi:hypothetical protein